MKGFALIEVLVALLILSLGLLGIVGMQLSALQHSQGAYFHSLATTQLSSLFERLRVNQSATKRSEELNDWNTINARLLPQGAGSYHCQGDVCTAQVQWTTKSTQTASLSARL